MVSIVRGDPEKPECKTDIVCNSCTPEDAKIIVAAVNDREALLSALRKIKKIAKAGVIHRNETGKPQWSAFDEIKKIVSKIPTK